ncbi:MAG: YggS family pyridoxal phosphate enzyme [Spirochaetales bacterium]|nr:YggS family pyridoxal phosphate enzyme [Leptospiraceae bacterium]MCP5483693.1 YggS family pyridoxal phosphate enzyme [Spirochaetales bacterium]
MGPLPNQAEITDRVHALRTRLQELGRPDVRIIGVTKTHGPEAIRALLEAGISDIAENRQNEARDKFPLVDLNHPTPVPTPIYHHIGPLQSGAARQIPGLFHYVHGASSEKAIRVLAAAADRYLATVRNQTGQPPPPLHYLIQVRLTDEESKLGGMEVDQLCALAPHFPESEGLKCAGLMAMGPESGAPDEARRVFRRLRELRDDLLPGKELSMGMSQDWEVAVSEGATMIRVGSILLGPRAGAPWKPVGRTPPKNID